MVEFTFDHEPPCLSQSGTEIILMKRMGKAKLKPTLHLLSVANEGIILIELKFQMQANEEVCEEDGRGKKWMCEYCTYSNWPSSSKCTMCRGNKPSRLIKSENIYSSVNNCNNQRGKIIK